MRQATQSFTEGTYDAVYIGVNEFKLRDYPEPCNGTGFAGTAGRAKAQMIVLMGWIILYEPSDKAILERILPLHLNTQMWKAVLESNALSRELAWQLWITLQKTPRRSCDSSNLSTTRPVKRLLQNGDF